MTINEFEHINNDAWVLGSAFVKGEDMPEGFSKKKVFTSMHQAAESIYPHSLVTYEGMPNLKCLKNPSGVNPSTLRNRRTLKNNASAALLWDEMDAARARARNGEDKGDPPVEPVNNNEAQPAAGVPVDDQNIPPAAGVPVDDQNIPPAAPAPVDGSADGSNNNNPPNGENGDGNALPVAPEVDGDAAPPLLNGTPLPAADPPQAETQPSQEVNGGGLGSNGAGPLQRAPAPPAAPTAERNQQVNDGALLGGEGVAPQPANGGTQTMQEAVENHKIGAAPVSNQQRMRMQNPAPACAQSLAHVQTPAQASWTEPPPPVQTNFGYTPMPQNMGWSAGRQALWNSNPDEQSRVA